MSESDPRPAAGSAGDSPDDESPPDRHVLRPVAGMGGLYLAAAIVLGAVFTGLALALRRDASPQLAMRLFSWSITYITLLFGAMALDQLVRSGV